jgi:hypothetical protein
MRRQRIRCPLQWRGAGARRRLEQLRRHEIGTENHVDAPRREVAQQRFNRPRRG